MRIRKAKHVSGKLARPDVIQLSRSEVKALLKELKPQLEGMVVGEFPKYEELCKLVGFDAEFVA